MIFFVKRNVVQPWLTWVSWWRRLVCERRGAPFQSSLEDRTSANPPTSSCNTKWCNSRSVTKSRLFKKATFEGNLVLKQIFPLKCRHSGFPLMFGILYKSSSFFALDFWWFCLKKAWQKRHQLWSLPDCHGELSPMQGPRWDDGRRPNLSQDHRDSWVTASDLVSVRPRWASSSTISSWPLTNGR